MREKVTDNMRHPGLGLKLVVLTAVFFASVCSSIGYAGVKEGGGGEVYGDALNPWFLENTETVSYCIEVDSNSFGASSASIESAVGSAINQWKSAFAAARANETANNSIEPYGMVRIATQKFMKESCTPSTMVRFQFGVLSEEQRTQFLSNPTQVIAETIRTSYDKVNLRGRGFIYIAPESGSLRPTGLKMADHPWSFRDGLILRRILLHELGHLFGLSHSGNAYSLMGQDHPEYIVQQSTIERLSAEPAEAVEQEFNRIGVFGFEFPFMQESCLSDSTIYLGGQEQNEFFGFSAGSRCHKFVFSKNGFEVYASSGTGQSYTLIGQSSSPESQEVIQSALLRVKLSEKQQVFKKLPPQALATGYMDGPATEVRRVIKANYQSTDGFKSGEVKTTFLPGQQMQMDAILNGRFFEVFQ